MSVARNIAVTRRAVRERWVSDEMGMRIAEEMERIALGASSIRDRVQAARVVAQLAAVDTSRDRNDTTERGQDLTALTQFTQALARDNPKLYSELCQALADIQQRKQLPPADDTLPIIAPADGVNGMMHR